MTERALELQLVNLVVDRLRGRIEERDLPTVRPGLQIDDSSPQAVPAVLVFLAGDDATESAVPAQGAYQRVTATLAVVHVVKAANTKRGSGGRYVDDLALLAGLTRAQLNGWREPDWPARRDTMQLRRGRLLDIVDGRAWWQDEYNVSWRANRVPADQN